MGTILGQLLAPLLHDWVARRANRGVESRADRKAAIRSLQAHAGQVLLLSINEPSEREGWSDDYRKSVLEFMVAVNEIALGVGNAADLQLRTALIQFPNEFRNHGSPMELWTLIGGKLIELNDLIDRPRRYPHVITSMQRYMTQDAAERATDTEAATEASTPSEGGERS